MGVNMMSDNQINSLSPAGRVRNSYESLYYNVNSNDPEADEVVRGHIQSAFKKHNVVLTDNPTVAQLRSVMVSAYKESILELDGGHVSDHTIDAFEQDFDRFAKDHPSFYASTFSSYEDRYDGETVDFSADYTRAMSDVDLTPSEDDIDQMFESVEREGFEDAVSTMKTSGLSYTGHVPDSKLQTKKRTYMQIKEEEMAAAEMKGEHDRKYDEYARNRQGGYQKTTAGDDYGFDEHDYELEDDGPEF